MVSIKEAIRIINEANPFMGALLKSNKSLIEYCKKISTHQFHSEHLKRQEPYKFLIKKKVNTLFGDNEIKINYDQGLILDTTDHHGILNFPSTVGAHLIMQFNTIYNRSEEGDYFVLNCGNVPFFDALNKRGVKINDKHLNLYPKSAKNKLVARFPMYEYNILEYIKNSDNSFTEREIIYLKKLQNIINEIDFSTCKKISDQIVKINHKVWLEMFDPKEVDNVRRCITLEHDEMLIDYLSEFLLSDENNIIWKSLFENGFRQIVLKEFDGIYGAWNYSRDNSGTYFFWGYSKEDGKEYRLVIENNLLISPDHKIRDVELTPIDISKALKEGILIPSIFTKFSVVAFYLGAKTCGGPGQTEYTGKMEKAWLTIIDNYYQEEKYLTKYWSVMNFNCADIAFTRNEAGDLHKEWGMDVAMNHTFSKKYLNKIGKIKFKYFLYPMIPISYFRLTPAEKRDTLEDSKDILYQGFKNI